MASWDHEGIVELFRCDPRLAAELLQGPLGLDLPAFVEARVESGAVTQLNPAELHADLVVSLNDDTRAVLAIVVEAQRGVDPDKCFSWPAYVASLRHRLRCEVCLLVVTQSERVANWAARLIRLEPGSSLQPLVLRPSVVPVIEVDDRSHELKRTADARRDGDLARLGYRVLRLPAELVRSNVEQAVARIVAALSVAT